MCAIIIWAERRSLSLVLCVKPIYRREVVYQFISHDLLPGPDNNYHKNTSIYHKELFITYLHWYMAVCPDLTRERYAHNANSSTYVRMVARAA